MMRTPRDPRHVEQLAAQGSPVDAIVAAWTDLGAKPGWHRKAQADVRRAMPVLAAAIDRAVAERGGRGRLVIPAGVLTSDQVIGLRAELETWADPPELVIGEES